VADDPSQADDAAPDSAQALGPSDAGPGALGDQPAARRFRRRPNFRGHIVVDDDEPLAVFDAPAEPLPAPPAAPDGHTSQG
jgi:hypothetical protein